MKSIEDVKRELPPVKIKIGDAVYYGTIKGRKAKFPIVYVSRMIAFSGGLFYNQYFHFSWDAIVRAINNNSCLTV